MIYESYEPPQVLPPQPQTSAKSAETGEPSLKILLIGDSGTGRRNLVRTFAEQGFNTDISSSMEPATNKLYVEDNNKRQEVSVRVEVAADRGKFPGRPYRSANAVIMVCDVTDLVSFNNLREWKRKIEHYARENIPVFLAATKCDQQNKRVVEQEQLKALGKELGLAGVSEVSSKQNPEGVKKLFNSIASRIYLDQKVQEIAEKGLMQAKVPQPSSPRSLGKGLLHGLLSPFKFIRNKISSIFSNLFLSSKK